MSEGSSEVHKEKGISRRSFLKAAVTVPPALVLANEAKHELRLAREGSFETEDAIWHPIYERHDRHDQILIPDNIPVSLDALSLEGMTLHLRLAEGSQVEMENDLQAPIHSILLGTIEGKDTVDPSVNHRIPFDTLRYLQQNNIPVAFGDIDYSSLSEWKFNEKIENLQVLRENIGKFFAMGGAGVAWAGVLSNNSTIGRRKFLGLAGLTAAGVGATLAVPDNLRKHTHEAVMDSFDQSYARQRIAGRAQSISNVLLPEYLNDLFRELVQTNKLITMAKNLKENGDGKKPCIGYNWHSGHRGIEDWIRVGQEVTRSCILAYPDSVLRDITVANNNDPRSLYAIRLSHMPKSLKVLSEDSTGITFTYDDEEVVKEDIFEDKTLMTALSDRNII